MDCSPLRFLRDRGRVTFYEAPHGHVVQYGYKQNGTSGLGHLQLAAKDARDVREDTIETAWVETDSDIPYERYACALSITVADGCQSQ
jgi:hypothetical protein